MFASNFAKQFGTDDFKRSFKPTDFLWTKLSTSTSVYEHLFLISDGYGNVSTKVH